MTLVVIAAALIAAGALYIRLRWRRSPQAYRAMIANAVCYFAAGAILGGWFVHLVAPAPPGQREAIAPDAGATGVGGVSLPNSFAANVLSILDGHDRHRRLLRSTEYLSSGHPLVFCLARSLIGSMFCMLYCVARVQSFR